ncbi:MAG: cell envelope integrity protein CreD [Armatimonadetes bacterium]|nr:cell envelope integrity protein CreD [Armatimonadota bacterium]
MTELNLSTRTSVTLKVVAVGLLVVVLLIPAGLIMVLVREREGRRNQAVAEISESWARPQAISGPVLVIPVRLAEKDNKGKKLYRTVYASFLPEDLEVSGRIDTETRYRGIYKAAVYTAKLTVKGEFASPDFDRLSPGTGEILWDQGILSLGISDLRGVKDIITVNLDDQRILLDPGTGAATYLDSGVSARLPKGSFRNPTKATHFSFVLSLKGSQGLYFVPVGKTTRVSLSSPWNAPSFRGAFLPDSRNVRPDGFDSNWKVLHINRNFPQAWVKAPNDLYASNFGVDLLIRVDHYSSTERAIKYAILYIFLTFLAFFFVEFFGKKQLHPIQYLLVGSGIVLFYLLLLSLSEHLAFNTAYLLASLGVAGVISGYVQGALEHLGITAVITAILAILYGFLYTLLQLEDYSLLLGSLGLLLALAIVMYLTRKIDWYNIERKS